MFPWPAETAYLSSSELRGEQNFTPVKGAVSN